MTGLEDLVSTRADRAAKEATKRRERGEKSQEGMESIQGCCDSQNSCHRQRMMRSEELKRCTCRRFGTI